ncbi:MAG: flagellar biosynthetic protein FliO [Candidatus Saganbacteria bacterium]|nr:flagellar biosynthetic protein FliO [Candidatus Saganbacteria bacterium]
MKNTLKFAMPFVLLQNIAFAIDLNSPASLETYALKEQAPLTTFGYFFQVFLSLLFVFALIYIFSKYFLPKFKVSGTGRFIEVVERVGLEPGVSSYIIKVREKSWLVLISNKNIQLIERLEEPPSNLK